jgi:hypothetical protein
MSELVTSIRKAAHALIEGTRELGDLKRGGTKLAVVDSSV